MRIIIDGMGGDNAPEVIVNGTVAALKETDAELAIVGREDEIKKALSKAGYSGDRITVVNADSVITNDEAPVKAVRHKKDSSIVVGLEMVKAGEGDVFLSAGSTGALLAGGFFILGRIKGIDRPTLAAVYPVMGREPSLLTDAGANTECKPNNLLQFATMGAIYMEKVMGRANPRVGLVNNGAEETKGTILTKAAHQLLAESGLNFVGNVEARYLPDGACDVIVTDGFTGNAILKTTEGMGLIALKELKKMLTSNPKTKMAALMLTKELLRLKEEFNYTEYGGAPILGIKGGLIKMHGSSDETAVKQSILKAVPFAEGKVVDIIQESVYENGDDFAGDLD